MYGDSVKSEAKLKLNAFISKVKQLSETQLKAHLVLDDPAGNSYIQVGSHTPVS